MSTLQFMLSRLFVFSVSIEKILNIPLAEKDTVVEIQVGLYNGGKKLSEMTTAPISLKQGITWKEKLIFDLSIQRIPKVMNNIQTSHTINNYYRLQGY